MNSNKIIKNRKVIIGLLKETIFLDGHVSAITNSNFIPLKIDQINEKENYILLNSLQKNAIKPECEIEIKIGIGCLSYVFKSELIHEDGNHRFKTEIPNLIMIYNYRTSYRKEISKAMVDPCDVLIYTSNNILEARFQLHDFSTLGLGGFLNVFNEYIPRPGDKLLGKAFIQGRPYKIDGEIRRVEHESDNMYFIGLKKKEDARELQSINVSEKRKYQRINKRCSLKIVNILDIEQIFNVNTIDFSVSGFKINLESNEKKSPYFTVGSLWKIIDYDLICELYKTDKDVANFIITDGTIKSRYNWYNSFARESIQNITSNLADIKKIIKMFCESGALSAEYLKAQKHRYIDYINYLQKEESSNFWIHRWLSLNDEGDPNGQISSMRFSDNTWVFSDLVGSQDDENRFPPQLRQKFLRAFSEWSLTCSPCPKHFFLWVKNHGFWKKYREYLTQNPKFCIASCDVAYTRLSSSALSYSINNIFSKIESSDFQQIFSIRRRATELALEEFLDIFDFNIDNFSSPDLARNFKDHDQGFERSYYFSKEAHGNWLAVINKFPSGASLNRLVDSVWIFDLNKIQVDENNWREIVNELQVLALKEGVSAPSIRRIVSAQQGNLALYKNEITKLDCYIVHPSYWIEASKEIE